MNPLFYYRFLTNIEGLRNENNVNIYSCLNDCSCVNIKIPINQFVDRLINEPYILL